MEFLPPAASLITCDPVVIAFQRLAFQARNQAKAATKNGYPIAQNGSTVEWILLIGPYWTPVTSGPFTDAQLNVHALKPTPSADWKETVREDKIFRASAPPLQELFLLSDDASDICSAFGANHRFNGWSAYRCDDIIRCHGRYACLCNHPSYSCTAVFLNFGTVNSIPRSCNALCACPRQSTFQA
jgi:hypothetical protein